MKKSVFISIILLLFLRMSFSAVAQNVTGGNIPNNSLNAKDSIANAKDSIMTYEDIALILKIFDGGQPKDVIPKAEILINTSKSEKEKILITDAIYDYYRNSKIMGYDEIAIYFAENYFLNDKLKHPDKDKLLEMKLFSEFNKRSLIGMKGEELVLQDPAGRNISILNGNQDYTILYFYDDQCPNCIKFTPSLYQFLMKKSKINYSVFFIYTQDSRERWINYISKTANIFKLPDNVRLNNVWDPDMSSEFPMKYGVLSTPQLFLLDRNGIIIGRGLTPIALSQVVNIYQNTMNETEKLFEEIFVPLASNSDSTVLTKEIDTFFNDSKDNVPFFNELFYTLYQYLKSSSYYTLQQAAAYLANKYIAGMPEMWKDVQFTNTGVTKGNVIRGEYASVQEFIDETKLGIKMFYRNMLNKPVTNLKLKNSRKKNINLNDIEAEYTVLYFYSLSCKLCETVAKDLITMKDKYGDKGVKFIAIYTDKDKKWKEEIKKTESDNWINLWDPKGKSKMQEKFDLLDVPAIYLLDNKKIVLAKDINPDILDRLLEYYLANGKD